MKRPALITKIHATQEDEILCSDCLDQISVYVDMQLDGSPAEALMPRLQQHLGQCQICQDEYELLRDLVALDRAGQLPARERLERQIRAARPGGSDPTGAGTKR